MCIIDVLKDTWAGERERGFTLDKIKKNEENETKKEKQVEEGDERNKND